MPFRNQLLASLPAPELTQLRPYLTRIRLSKNMDILVAGKNVESLLFVEHGLVSMVAEVDDGPRSTEVGVVGSEGVVGLTALLLPEPRSFVRAVVQIPGVGYSVPRSTCAALLKQLPVFHTTLLRYLSDFMVQVTQTAACNARHSVFQRLARWLLLAHDRTGGDELPLTQGFLAMMLAVRRSGVSVALRALEVAGAVDTSRGQIFVLSRAKLELASCGCHQRVQRFTAKTVRLSAEPSDVLPS